MARGLLFIELAGVFDDVISFLLILKAALAAELSL